MREEINVAQKYTMQKWNCHKPAGTLSLRILYCPTRGGNELISGSEFQRRSAALSLAWMAVKQTYIRLKKYSYAFPIKSHIGALRNKRAGCRFSWLTIGLSEMIVPISRLRVLVEIQVAYTRSGSISRSGKSGSLGPRDAAIAMAEVEVERNVDGGG